jgi:hypothetical protein
LIKQFVQELPTLDEAEFVSRCEEINRKWNGSGELTAMVRRAFVDYAIAVRRGGVAIQFPIKPQPGHE